MSKFSNFIDNIPDKAKELPKVQRGNTIYYSSKNLTKKTKLNIFTNKRAFLIFAIALGIAIITILFMSGTVLQKTIISSSSVEDILSKDVKYNLPQVTNFLDKSNNEIDEELPNMIKVKNEHPDDDENYYDKYKAPNDDELDKAKKIINKGLPNLDPDEAAYIYYGGWELTVDRSNKTYSRVKYVDFKSHTEEQAIKMALQSQTFENVYVSQSDKDELGNTYSTGTAKVNNKNISWRISAIKFSEVYNIKLPDDTIYVGIRVE